ncbi:uncharacterized protein K441DRAFT_109997 [Cenococcum geophilum 1.58]|uniref:uncharacterized protein n=1 Tax=Cenococcum geophilum 1.58 TaxID=794803 RepID=UPI00358F77A2|nr:hypothetical protein K441DRAFT_109997 [Cenococcum geophilum 1.58]
MLVRAFARSVLLNWKDMKSQRLEAAKLIAGRYSYPMVPPHWLRLHVFVNRKEEHLFQQRCIYSDVHDQLHPPPLASAARFQIRYVHPISLGYRQLYIVIIAKPYAWLQERRDPAVS